jgi:hypothetical protein
MGSFVLQACTKRHQVPRQKYEIIRNNETKGTFDGTNSKPDQKLGRDDTTWITEIQAEYNYRFFPDRAKANWKHIDPSGKQPTPTTKTSLRSYYPVPTPAAHVRASAASTSWLRTIATLSPRDKTTTNQLATARNRRRITTTACRGIGEAQRVDSAPPTAARRSTARQPPKAPPHPPPARGATERRAVWRGASEADNAERIGERNWTLGGRRKGFVFGSQFADPVALVYAQKAARILEQNQRPKFWQIKRHKICQQKYSKILIFIRWFWSKPNLHHSILHIIWPRVTSKLWHRQILE